MPNKPYRTWRRWFQWRLSTWLVLVAILAWSKAVRPYLEYETKKGQHEWTLGDATRPGWTVVLATDGPTPATGLASVNLLYFGPAPALAYPFALLLLFLAWKGFWLTRQRRRELS